MRVGAEEFQVATSSCALCGVDELAHHWGLCDCRGHTVKLVDNYQDLDPDAANGPYVIVCVCVCARASVGAWVRLCVCVRAPTWYAARAIDRNTRGSHTIAQALSLSLKLSLKPSSSQALKFSHTDAHRHTTHPRVRTQMHAWMHACTDRQTLR